MQSSRYLTTIGLMGRVDEEKVVLLSSPLLLLLLLLYLEKPMGKRGKQKDDKTPTLFDTVHKKRLNNENEAGLISASSRCLPLMRSFGYPWSLNKVYSWSSLRRKE
jgi:hypothetical protein